MVKVLGLPKALSNLSKVANTIKARTLRKAITAGSKPIRAALQDDAPKRTGTLKRGQAVKIKSFRKGETIVARIGASTKIYKNGKRASRYSHLVDGGFRTRNGRQVAGIGYVGRAHRRTAARAKSIMESTIRADIAAIARSVRA